MNQINFYRSLEQKINNVQAQEIADINTENQYVKKTSN